MTGFSKRTALSCAAAAALLGGCQTLAVAPAEPEIAVPADWQIADPAPISTDLTTYWTLLGDPLLTEFVEQAIVQNRNIVGSVARLRQGRASLRQARAGFLPSVGASGGASRRFGSGTSDDVFFDVGADVSWEADLFGQISGGVRAAEGDLVAQGYGLADLQRLIVGQVAIATVDARSIAEQLAIARSTLAIQDDNLQIARWRNEAGLVSSLDVEQARTQRGNTAATIPSLEAALVQTANGISTLIGEPPGRVYAALSADTDTVPVPPELAGFDAPAAVLRRRPDVRSAEASLIASTARIGVARAQLLPLVRLTGNIGAGPNTAGNLFDLVTGGLFAGVSQLIFDGGRTRAQIDIAEAGADVALANWEQTILLALEDVESSAAARRSAGDRVFLTEDVLNAAETTALLARSQYEAGLTDFQVLLTAENQLLNARNQIVQAQADRAIAFIRLTQALGGGWTETDLSLPHLPDASFDATDTDRTD